MCVGSKVEHANVEEAAPGTPTSEETRRGSAFGRDEMCGGVATR